MVCLPADFAGNPLCDVPVSVMTFAPVLDGCGGTESVSGLALGLEFSCLSVACAHAEYPESNSMVWKCLHVSSAKYLRALPSSIVTDSKTVNDESVCIHSGKRVPICCKVYSVHKSSSVWFFAPKMGNHRLQPV